MFHCNFKAICFSPLHKCANYYLDDDYEKPYVFNVPLPPPIPEHVGFLDDYPNYGESLDEFSIEDVSICCFLMETQFKVSYCHNNLFYENVLC